MNKKNDQTVSVIMCVYNGDKYLYSALESIENQKMIDLELIIINDGSTDNSLIIINEFILKNKNIKTILVNQTNQGLTKSLNTAIKLAKGKYIARMDADDISHPKRLCQSLNHLISNDLDFVCTRASFFTGSIECNEEIKKNPFPSFIHNKNMLSKRSLIFGNMFAHGTYFAKKEVFLDLMYDEAYRSAQDYDFLCRLVKSKYKIQFIPDILYYIRVNPESIGRKKGSTQTKNAQNIVKKHFKTDLFFINNKSGLKRILLSILKRIAIKL